MIVGKTEKLKSKAKFCKWCGKSLPSNYHLIICPKCRKASISAYMTGEDETERIIEVTVARKE